MHKPFRSACQEIECGIVIEQEVFGVAGLRTNDIWTLDWVSAEKDGLSLSAHAL